MADEKRKVLLAGNPWGELFESVHFQHATGKLNTAEKSSRTSRRAATVVLVFAGGLISMEGTIYGVKENGKKTVELSLPTSGTRFNAALKGMTDKARTALDPFKAHICREYLKWKRDNPTAISDAAVEANDLDLDL